MARRVVVTGGSGKLGRAVVTELRTHGWKVVVVDKMPHPDSAVPSVVADLRDFGQAMEIVTGVDSRLRRVDAVVHLAAVPGPGLRTDTATFENNLMATFNVFTAAQRAGVHTIVWASSETLLGIPFATPPPYLPVDENCPARPESAYSLAKYLEEAMAAEFARRNPESSLTALRLSNVLDASDYAQIPGYQHDATMRRWNLWAYIDTRDGAQAVRKALECARPGYEMFVIANADTVMERSTAELVAEQFPDVPTTREFSRHETLLCIDKARRLLGFEPEHGWRDEVPASVPSNA
ncbi:NAD-dependent epimerase/dehydratase family protein [Rhodococcus aetherivorans]|uniref:NAD-dependent epimerase/dehydratase family protein n=1 Tax=Rhodococcus aetherivorans TaxID=191292 RepID=UPI00241C8570|nr:NAD(P)-dependent oxidoreductase [Rhodococcus aetherivorans]WFS11032.1 NAD(P)-dependent oxidoreductase [Rhodococcus aetherivorans]